MSVASHSGAAANEVSDAAIALLASWQRATKYQERSTKFRELGPCPSAPTLALFFGASPRRLLILFLRDLKGSAVLPHEMWQKPAF